MSGPKNKQPAGWGWPTGGGSDFPGLQGPARGHAAAAAAISLVWAAAVVAGVHGLRSGTEVLRLAGAAVVGLPPVGLLWFVKRRLQRLDEFQALLESRALMTGALWALSFGALMFAITALQQDPAPAWLIAILPPAAFCFGALMLIIERQTLAGPEDRP